jgi:hypothetical protein
VTVRGGDGIGATAITVGAFIALCALSVVLAVIGAFASTSVWGAVIAVVGNLALGIGGAWAMRSRAVPVLTGGVWVLTALALSSTGPGHDTVIADKIPGVPRYGVAFLVSGVVAVAVAVGLVTSRRWARWTAARPLHPAAGTADEDERDPARPGG